MAKVDAEALEQELGRLPDLSVDELRDRWRDLYGRDPPPKIGKPIMVRAVAYGMQVRVYGGLKPETKRLLRRVAEEARLGKQIGLPTPTLRPGTRLLRTWHGVTHEVVVLENGALYEGKTYRSLTAVAKVITGNHWSGPVFFGVIKRNRAAHGD